MRRQYITVEGEVRQYEYLRSENKQKPLCPTCNERLRYVYKGNNPHDRAKIGYICTWCNAIFIDNKFKLFRVKRWNNEAMSEM